MISACIITIGDELLIGQTIDTNSAWLAIELNRLGIRINRRIAVADSKEAIIGVLDEEIPRNRLLLLTGGLGPTADDVTKPSLCDYFDTPLVQHKEVEDHLRKLFSEKLKRDITPRNLSQAMLPRDCKVLMNPVGTAPGMWFEKEGCVIISMPGVPFEMQEIMRTSVLPMLSERFLRRALVHKTLVTIGIPESDLADMVQPLETMLPPGITLAYLPNFGSVKLRLSATESASLDDLDVWYEKFAEKIKPYLIDREDREMQELVFELLKKSGKTLSTAESCTGGYIAHCITRIPGASAVYSGSAVTYSNEAKEKVLGVKKSTLETHGAVSEATVREMVTSILNLMETDYALAVSGILGPGGGTPEKPTGTVWMAAATKDRIISKKYFFRYNRENNLKCAAIYGLDMVRRLITQTGV